MAKWDFGNPEIKIILAVWGAIIIGFGIFAWNVVTAYGATYYLGTSPSTSFSYNMYNGNYSPLILVSSSTASYATAISICSSSLGRVGNQLDWLYNMQMQFLNGSTTYPFVNSRYYVLADKSASGQQKLCRYDNWYTGYGFGHSCNSYSAGNNYFFCVSNTSTSEVTVTGTFIGWNDSLQIATASSSEGGGGMDPNDVKIIIYILISGLFIAILDFIRRFFAKK